MTPSDRLGAILQAVALCVLSTILLSLGFYQNQWKAADQNWFDSFQRDSESAILGRLVKSRHDGILSSGGLTGRGNAASWELTDAEIQYQAYAEDLKFENFQTYDSQIGFQGLFFGLLDKS